MLVSGLYTKSHIVQRKKAKNMLTEKKVVGIFDKFVASWYIFSRWWIVSLKGKKPKTPLNLTLVIQIFKNVFDTADWKQFVLQAIGTQQHY